jgi:crotonobetaine/carnitine-CoA ligase
MLAGGQTVLAPKFSASRFWDHMRDYNVSMFSIIGTVMQIIWKQPPSPRDKDHNVRITWGGPITIEPAAFEERFGVRVLPGDGVFGMTETGVVNMSSFNATESGKIRSIYQVRIGDDNDAAVAPGEVGEILVRPEEPGVLFSGYAGMPEATIAAWRNLWFHTGDLGKMDSQGRMTFIGRKKERIRSGGHNISSWEVEEVIDRHEAILECAVIGVPSELGEEDVKAYVVLRPGASLSKDELIAFCTANMARFMVPRQVEFIEEMPKTQSGKPAKGKLSELHKSAAGG